MTTVIEPVKFTDDTYRSLSNPSQFTKRRYLPMELSDCNYVILWTNRVKCALNTNILYLLNEESVSRESSARKPVYKFDEKSYHKCLKR